MFNTCYLWFSKSFSSCSFPVWHLTYNWYQISQKQTRSIFSSCLPHIRFVENVNLFTFKSVPFNNCQKLAQNEPAAVRVSTLFFFSSSVLTLTQLMKASWPTVIKITPLPLILIGSVIRNASVSLFNCKGTFGIQFLKCIFNEKHYILT